MAIKSPTIKPELAKTPWNIIAIAAIAVSIVLVLVAANSLLSNNPATTTTNSGSQPALVNPGSGIPPNEPDDSPAITPTSTKMPSSDEIVPYGTLIDISDLPTSIQTYKQNLVIIIEKISDDKIKASYTNTGQQTIRIQPVLIAFFNSAKIQMKREQYICRYNFFQYRENVGAHCQWPEDYCDTSRSSGTWEEYWEEKSGSEKSEKRIGENDIVPRIEIGQKYSFTINCPVPPDTQYIKIT